MLDPKIKIIRFYNMIPVKLTAGVRRLYICTHKIDYIAVTDLCVLEIVGYKCRSEDHHYLKII